MAIYKVEAAGDVVYINATDEAEARKRLQDVMGQIPKRMLKFSVCEALPEGEEFL